MQDCVICFLFESHGQTCLKQKDQQGLEKQKHHPVV